MTSQSALQEYMEKHRVKDLFEDLMNKLLHNRPDEPLIYLLRCVYKKAGMEIPQGIRYGGLRKSVNELPKSSSPDRKPRAAAVSGSADVAASRNKTLSPTRVSRSRDDTRLSKSKPDWNADIKTKPSFDELWGENSTAKREKSATKSSPTRRSTPKMPVTGVNAWAMIGLEGEGEKYVSPVISTLRRKLGHGTLNDEDYLAAEKITKSSRSSSRTAELTKPLAASGHHSRKLEAIKHKQELATQLRQNEQQMVDSGIELDSTSDQENSDTIELLEDAEDLRQEGVRNIPAAGYKLSRNLKYRRSEPQMKLCINTYAYPSENIERYESPDTERFSTDLDDADEEEFESVSQVSGPRQPVWRATGPKGDDATLQPSYSVQVPQKMKVPQKSFTEKSIDRKQLDDFLRYSVNSAENLVASGRTWTVGDKAAQSDNEYDARVSERSAPPNSNLSGWRLPDDSDVNSEFDWNQRVKGNPSRDPRVY